MPNKIESVDSKNPKAKDGMGSFLGSLLETKLKERAAREKRKYIAILWAFPVVILLLILGASKLYAFERSIDTPSELTYNHMMAGNDLLFEDVPLDSDLQLLSDQPNLTSVGISAGRLIKVWGYTCNFLKAVYLNGNKDAILIECSRPSKVYALIKLDDYWMVVDESSFPKL